MAYTVRGVADYRYQGGGYGPERDLVFEQLVQNFGSNVWNRLQDLQRQKQIYQNPLQNRLQKRDIHPINQICITDRQWTVYLNSGEMGFSAVIDTRSKVTLLNNKVLEGRVNIKNCNIKMIEIIERENKHLDVEGKCRLGVYFPNQEPPEETKTFHHDFIIVKNLPVQAILGNDFLKKYNCKMDYGEQTIEMENFNEKVLAQLHEGLMGRKTTLITTKGTVPIFPVFKSLENQTFIGKPELKSKEEPSTEISSFPPLMNPEIFYDEDEAYLRLEEMVKKIIKD